MDGYLGFSTSKWVFDALFGAFSHDVKVIEVGQLLAGEVASPKVSISPDFHGPVASLGHECPIIFNS